MEGTGTREALLDWHKAATNTLVYVLEITCFHLLYPLMTTHFTQFAFYSFAWACGHAGGGIVLLAFNPQIRRKVFRPYTLVQSDTKSPIKITVVQPSPTFNNS